MKKVFSVNELKRWATNFSDNQDLPFITNSALIKLQELEDFISEIKPF